MKTKEEIIEAIREKVVIANNPECKTYEVAKKEELKKEGCQVLWISGKDKQIYTRLSNKKTMCSDLSQYLIKDEMGIRLMQFNSQYFFENIQLNITDLEKTIFLGLPLTLDRVLTTLDKTINSVIDLSIAVDGKFFITFVNPVEEPFYWQPNKTLENQSENTIEQIYQILCLTK